MDGEPDGAKLIRELKPKLIDILSVDPDFLLQHAHSLYLLSQREYDHVKALTDPSDKARDILDFIIKKDGTHAQKFITLLKKTEMQTTFPQLLDLKDKITDIKKMKRKHMEDLKEEVPSKQSCRTNEVLVSEKQLMQVARRMGRSWREMARVALEVPSIRLEQFEEENPRSLVEQVFAMLHYWKRRERNQATAARLHALLTQAECDSPPEDLDFLLDSS